MSGPSGTKLATNGIAFFENKFAATLVSKAMGMADVMVVMHMSCVHVAANLVYMPKGMATVWVLQDLEDFCRLPCQWCVHKVDLAAVPLNGDPLNMLQQKKRRAELQEDCNRQGRQRCLICHISIKVFPSG